MKKTSHPFFSKRIHIVSSSQLRYIFSPLFFLTLFFNFSAFSQQKIDMGFYKSYFSITLREPLYVTFYLYQGGGGCPRDGMSFTNCGAQTATDDDYKGSSLEKGHLANAKDFAYDCTLERKTFCYYNCVPQTQTLNRGVWKSWETKIRALSQNQHLFIIAGAVYDGRTMGPNQIGIPSACYKIVLSLPTKEMLYCLYFPNDGSNTCQNIDLSELKSRLHYNLVP